MGAAATGSFAVKEPYQYDKRLEEKTVDDIVERGKNRWGTFSICSTMKYCEDRLMDAVNGNPLANCMNEQSERMVKQIVAE